MAKTLCLMLLGVGLSILFLVPGRVHATLGGTVDSVESDRKVLSAVQGQVTAGAGYTVHEIGYSGTTVREYVSSDGTVFALAWNGNRSPDLQTLLGTYADQYNGALASTPHRPGVRHSSIKASDVVVERWGQVGHLQGRAYAPALIPTGVNIDEIK